MSIMHIAQSNTFSLFSQTSKYLQTVTIIECTVISIIVISILEVFLCHFFLGHNEVMCMQGVLIIVTMLNSC